MLTQQRSSLIGECEFWCQGFVHMSFEVSHHSQKNSIFWHFNKVLPCQELQEREQLIVRSVKDGLLQQRMAALATIKILTQTQTTTECVQSP